MTDTEYIIIEYKESSRYCWYILLRKVHCSTKHWWFYKCNLNGIFPMMDQLEFPNFIQAKIFEELVYEQLNHIMEQ